MSLKVGELHGILRLNDKEFTSGIDGAKNKLGSLSKSMADIGKTLTLKVTAPIMAVGSASIYALSKFDDSMSKVSAISGSTGQDLQNLRDMAKDLGSTTAHSASSAADAMSYLALAGWDANQILAATPDMLSLASAGAVDLARAADIVTDTMSGFQMEATRAGEAADVFALASAKSNTSVEQLGEAMKYAAPAANAAGMELADTAAILGVLADSGIKGSMAGTTFNAMLRDLKKSSKDGVIALGELLPELEGMDVRLYNADGSMRNMIDVMSDMDSSLGGLTTQQKDFVLSSLMGEESLKGMNIMLATGSGRLKDLSSQLNNATGSASRMAKTMEDNIGGSFRSLKSAIEGVLLNIAEILEPFAKVILDLLTKAALGFVKLPDGAKKAIVGIVALIAAVGPLLLVLSLITALLPMIITMLTTLATSFVSTIGPIAAVIAIVGAVGVALFTLWRENDEFKENVLKIWSTLKEMFTAFLDFITNVFNDLWGLMQWLASRFENTFAAIANIITVFAGLALEVLKNMFDLIFAVYEAFAGFLTGDFERFTGGLVDIWKSMWNIIKTVVAGAWALLRSAFNLLYISIREWFTGMANDAYNWGANMIQGFIDGIKSMIGRVADAARAVMDAAQGFLGFNSPAKEGPGRFIENWGANMVSGFMTGMKTKMPELQTLLAASMVEPKGIEVAYNRNNVSRDESPSRGNSGPQVNQEIHFHNTKDTSVSETVRKYKKASRELAYEW